MKQKFTILSALLAVMTILNTGGAAGAKSYDLSPALELISENISFSKCTVMTKEIRFTEEDFQNAFGKPLESVTVASLPSSSEGSLKYAGVSVSEGQRIPAKNLELLKFVPSGTACKASFSVFADDKDELCVSCDVNVLQTQNQAPNAKDQSVSAISGIGAHGQLDVYDSDGDEMTISVLQYPKNGVVKILGNGYIYTSAPSYSGKDSFTYVAYDKYGNVSEKASVQLSVEKAGTDVRYDDMTGHWGYASALKMTELGLMKGDKCDDSLLFNPDSPVTRGDFLAMAMICAGLEEKVVPGTATTFADDTGIPFNIRSYASYAEASGIVSGYQNGKGKAVFASSEDITRAEAVNLLANIIGENPLPTELNYSDADEIPEWAKKSFVSLISLGIINGNSEGSLEPQRTLTKAEAAQMLSKL